MARLKKYLDARASDSQERWLVSYADFITLLFGFFVVMYAISSVNEAKYRDVGSALGTAFGSAAAGPAAAGAAPGGQIVPLPLAGAARAEAARRKREERLRSAEQALAGAFGRLAENGEANVYRDGRGIVVDVGAGTLFAPGDATLRATAYAPLAAVAEVLKSLGQQVEIEGHTDDTPIRTERFPSNWELSTARAASVARFLQGQGVAPEKLSAVGYAEFRPVASNGDPAGRARNRRISVAVLDPAPEPVRAAGGAAQAVSAPPMEFSVGAPPVASGQ